MGYKAVYPEEAIQAHLAFLARRRALRPSEEYRAPTDEEWQQFLGHFERRKVSTGTCGRAFGTPCIHEHACVRCPMLWPDPAQRDRLAEIRDNLHARIAEAEREGWLGEVEGLQDQPRRRRRTSSPRSTGAGAAPAQPTSAFPASPTSPAAPPPPPQGPHDRRPASLRPRPPHADEAAVNSGSSTPAGCIAAASDTARYSDRPLIVINQVLLVMFREHIQVARALYSVPWRHVGRAGDGPRR